MDVEGLKGLGKESNLRVLALGCQRASQEGS